MRGAFITGTDTGVGKTRIGTALAAALLGADYRVRVRKPVESGCEVEDQALRPADGAKLAAAAGACDKLEVVTPIRLHAALSPERAAKLEGLQFGVDDLLKSCLHDINETDFLLVEGAGGFYSPIAPDGSLNSDLAAALQLPVILVVGDRLGCINHTLLTVQAIRAAGLTVAGVILNQLEPESASGMNNLQDLRDRLDVSVVQFPFFGADARGRLQAGWWRPLLEA